MPLLKKPLSRYHERCSFSGLLHVRVTVDAVIPSAQTLSFLRSETYLALQNPPQESSNHTVDTDRHPGPPSCSVFPCHGGKGFQMLLFTQVSTLGCEQLTQLLVLPRARGCSCVPFCFRSLKQVITESSLLVKCFKNKSRKEGRGLVPSHPRAIFIHS